MNLQIALIFEGFAEALTLATKLGVDAEKMVALIEATMVRSGVVDYKAPFVLQRDFHTELSIAVDAQGYSPHSGSCERSARETPGTRDRGRKSTRWPPKKGSGDLDYAATLTLLEKWQECK